MTKEVKAMGGEGKALAAEMMAAFEAYKSANDERLSKIEQKGAADTLLDEKLRKLDKRLDALSLKAARPEVAAGPDMAEHNAPGGSICVKVMKAVWRVWIQRLCRQELMIRAAMLRRRNWIA